MAIDELEKSGPASDRGRNEARSKVKRRKRRDRRRMLFVFDHMGALRNFEAPIVEALERGHKVGFVFLSEGDKDGGRPILDRLMSTYPDILLHKSAVKRERAFDRLGQLRALSDYLSYFHPDLVGLEAYRARARDQLSRKMRALAAYTGAETNALARELLMRGIEMYAAVTPVSKRVVQQLRKQRPDVVVLSPLISLRSLQYDYLSAAEHLRIPTALCVHSWDNLTTKGRLQALPKRVIVWNDAQKREAVRYHRVPEDRVVVTGAPCYDWWFDAQPSTDYRSFCAQHGFDPSAPTITYVGSSAFIGGDREGAFADKLFEMIRSKGGEKSRSANILVRPHPQNAASWHGFVKRERVTLFPEAGANPIDAPTRNDYVNSLGHAAVVVGLNTSAFLEACVLGRPVLSYADGEFRDRQDGTMHFKHLEEAKAIVVARALPEMLKLLERTIADERAENRRRRVASTLIRPQSYKRSATSLVVDALEALTPSPVQASKGSEEVTSGQAAPAES